MIAIIPERAIGMPGTLIGNVPEFFVFLSLRTL
jgi:hypothetical protein